MTPWPPAAAPEARTGLGRSNATVTFAVLGVLGLVVGVAGYSAAAADDSSARVWTFQRQRRLGLYPRLWSG